MTYIGHMSIKVIMCQKRLNMVYVLVTGNTVLTNTRHEQACTLNDFYKVESFESLQRYARGGRSK